MDATTAGADLLLGSTCPGCDRPARTVCRSCRRGLLQPRQVACDPVAVWAAGRYEGVLARTVVAWKENGRHGLSTPLGLLLAGVVEEAVSPRLGPRDPVVLVPIPTSLRNRRIRGADLTARMARRAAVELRELGRPATVATILRLRRPVRDQTSLGREDRRLNLDGAYLARPGGVTAPVVVVDDVVTTGATVTEAVRALRSAGPGPLVAAVVAAR